MTMFFGNSDRRLTQSRWAGASTKKLAAGLVDAVGNFGYAAIVKSGVVRRYFIDRACLASNSARFVCERSNCRD
jgi:hypothetical protein